MHDIDPDIEETLDMIYASCLEFYEEFKGLPNDSHMLIHAPIEDWKYMIEGFMFLYELLASKERRH